MRNKFDLECSVTSAVAEYSYQQNDKDFNALVAVSCKNGMADANVVTVTAHDVSAETIALSAIANYNNYPDDIAHARKWASHNQSTLEIAKLAAQIAVQCKGGDNA